MWDIYRVGHRDDHSHADCAIVLGAAAWHNKPSPVFRERLNHAISLYHDERVKTLILTGGFGAGAPYAESDVARRYCLQKGVPAKALFVENDSTTTQGNLTEAKKILTAQKITDSLLVSDPWHLKRAMTMANDLGVKAKPSATQTSRFRSFGARTKFLLGEFLLLHQYYLKGVGL